MQTLGVGPKGTRIVELTAEEYAVIGELQKALAGATFSFHEVYQNVHDDDIEDSFKAVYEFAKARFEINKMQELLDGMKRIVGAQQ